MRICSGVTVKNYVLNRWIHDREWQTKSRFFSPDFSLFVPCRLPVIKFPVAPKKPGAPIYYSRPDKKYLHVTHVLQQGRIPGRESHSAQKSDIKVN